MRDLTPEATRLLAKYYPLYCAHVERACRRWPHLAIEIEHGAWLAFRRACRKWDPARTPNFATYAKYGMQRSQPYNLRAGAPRRTPTVPLDSEEFAEPAAPPGPDPDARLDLLAVLGRMTHEDQRLLGLLYRDGLPSRAAAKRLGVCKWTVCQRHNRALADLRERMNAS